MIAAIRSLWRRVVATLAWLFGRRGTRNDEVLRFRLLQNKQVQADLGLDAAQVRQVARCTQAARQKRKEQFRDLQLEERKQAGFLKLQRQVAREVLAALNKEGGLTETQKERLQQLVWQRQGASAFRHPRVQEILKLTPEQRKGVRTILQETAKRMRELRGQEDKEAGGGDLVRTLQKEGVEKLVNLLDENQKQQWQQLKGKILEVDLEGSAAGRGRPGQIS